MSLIAGMEAKNFGAASRELMVVYEHIPVLEQMRLVDVILNLIKTRRNLF